MVAANVE